MSLIVEVNQGKLKGKENTSVLTGKNYYSFQRIPYAKPPLGELRFQAPKPPEKWEGIYDATYERECCIQIKLSKPSEQIGTEDCLYLNVNTPQIPSKIKIPKSVMVFIHGGAYVIGSGSEKKYSSDYLIGHDVIVVTFNYRLHALGFLNLGIPGCPGNAGLKDQLLALKWVKDNISHFGGDPENITIFGESAGATSVHYQTISPLTKGLFNKAIMQSGSTLCKWALTSKPQEVGLEFGKKLGFKGESKEELLVFLKQQNVDQLFKKAMELRHQSLSSKGSLELTFYPSVEAIKDGAFLPDLPEKLLLTADPLPIISGANDKDGMVIFIIFPNIISELKNGGLSVMLSHQFNIEPKSVIPDLVEKVKKHYFGNKEISSAEEICNLCTDVLFYHFYEAIENVTRSSLPAYIYEFAYNGGFNMEKRGVEQMILESMTGAAHGDELYYLFYPKQRVDVPPIQGDDLKVINSITTLWTNFAKFGIPSNELKWTPSTPTNPSYLLIDAESKIVNGTLYGERLQFLKNLLAPYLKPREP